MLRKGRHGDDHRHDPGRARRIELPGSEFLDEKKIQGSNMGSNRFRVDMPRYVDLYLSGRLKLDELVSRPHRAGRDQRRLRRHAPRRGRAQRDRVRGVTERTESPPLLGVAYFGNRYPHHARADLQAIAAGGAGFVVHTMSEADLRWNPGTIADLVAIGREFGLSSWLTPFAVAGVFGGEAASYAVADHPGAWQEDNREHHLPALCPRQPAFRSVMERWLDAAAAAGADIVQWDEPHLALSHRVEAAHWACRCAACREAFAARFGAAMPEAWNPQVAVFVDDLLTETLAWLVSEASARGLGSSVVLLAEEDFSPATWRASAALPGVRYFGCTPYWLRYGVPADEMPSYLRRWGARIVAATAGTAVEPLGWLQAFQVPAGREPEVERAAEELAAAGMRAIAVWAYLACAPMSTLAADDPEATWAAVMRAFARLGPAAESA